MKWIQAGSYLIQPTQQKVPVVEIFTNLNKPQPLAVVYNPKQEHALLFRDDKVGIILDYLDPMSIRLFDHAKEIAVCEVDEARQRVRYYYRVPLQRTKRVLDIRCQSE